MKRPLHSQGLEDPATTTAVIVSSDIRKDTSTVPSALRKAGTIAATIIFGSPLTAQASAVAAPEILDESPRAALVSTRRRALPGIRPERGGWTKGSRQAFVKGGRVQGSIMCKVEVGLDMKLVDAMNELRVWLDLNNYVPVSFEICKERHKRVLVRVVFAEDHIANAFKRQFAR